MKWSLWESLVVLGSSLFSVLVYLNAHYVSKEVVTWTDLGLLVSKDVARNEVSSFPLLWNRVVPLLVPKMD